MTRFRILALLAVLTAMAGVLAACGGGDSTSSNSSEDPQKVLENAGLEGVKSGNLDLSLHATSEGKEGGDVEFLTTCRIDTPVEIEYYRNGGILHTVLRRMLKGAR